MFDLPLHPIAVHIPITLGLLLPFLGGALFWSIKKNILPVRSWFILVLLSGVYFGSTLLAAELGEHDEEAVEKVVQESALEAHEEVGEKVPWVAGVVFLAFIAPLVFSRKESLKLVAVGVSLLATIPLIKAGHTGGELVYKYGAAQAHTKKLIERPVQGEGRNHDEDEDDED